MMSSLYGGPIRPCDDGGETFDDRVALLLEYGGVGKGKVVAAN